MYKYLVILYTGDGYASIVFKTEKSLISEQDVENVQLAAMRACKLDEKPMVVNWIPMFSEEKHTPEQGEIESCAVRHFDDFGKIIIPREVPKQAFGKNFTEVSGIAMKISYKKDGTIILRPEV